MALVLTGSALALAAGAPAADAAFTLAPCAGSGITGRGASFQNSLQAGFLQNFQTADFCGAGAPTVTYDGAGSGAGRRALGARDATNTLGARDAVVRFGATDDPPTAAQVDQMQKGPIVDTIGNADVTASDDGVLHVIPVAVGANAITVNFPNGCAIPAASLANAASADQTDRLKLPATLLEAAYYGDTSVDVWNELVPGITGTPTNLDLVGAGITTCANVPIRRVVRFDDSGTTFVQKDWLGKVNAARSPAWSTFLAVPNTSWPNPVNASTAATCPVNSNLCKNTSNGNGALLDLLNTVDGGIGYSDVATARSKGFEMTPNTADTTFWAPVVNAGGTAFEPTVDPTAYKTNVGARGANCASTTFANVPGGSDPTLGSWATTSGVGAPASTGYPLCSLTYDLVFDDHAKVYGNSAAEESKARTVKDYLTAAVSSVGQGQLSARDYAPLSLSLRTIAQTGVDAIGWNKSAGGGGGTPPPPPPPPPAVVTPPPPPPVVVVPSNVFTIPKVVTSSTPASASLKLSVQVPGPGTLVASAGSSYRVKTKTTKVTLGKLSGKATASGTVRVTIKLSAKGLLALKKAKTLRVAIKVVFTPTGGTARTVSKTVTLKAAKKKTT